MRTHRSLLPLLLLLVACNGEEVLDLGGAAGNSGEAGSSGAGGSPGDDASVAPWRCPASAGVAGASGWIVFDSDVVDLVRHVFAVNVADCSVVQLTSGAYNEQEPAVSPDGKTLVFSSNRTPDGTLQLYAMDVASRSVQELTSLAAGAGQPTFSPDGSSIAFHSNYGAYLMGADGTGAHEVIVSSTPDYGHNYEHPAFTRDGKNLVVDRLNEIDEFDLQGQNERSVIANGTIWDLYPAISPDGVNLALVSTCGPGSGALDDPTIVIAELAATGTDPCAARLWNPPTWGILSHPSWGPGGTTMAFAHQPPTPEGGSTLHRIAISDLAQHMGDLVDDDGDQLDPVWAPSTFNPQ
jgi:Tol biopolymer transport system component